MSKQFLHKFYKSPVEWESKGFLLLIYGKFINPASIFWIAITSLRHLQGYRWRLVWNTWRDDIFIFLLQINHAVIRSSCCQCKFRGTSRCALFSRVYTQKSIARGAFTSSLIGRFVIAERTFSCTCIDRLAFASVNIFSAQTTLLYKKRDMFTASVTRSNAETNKPLKVIKPARRSLLKKNSR